MAAVPALLVSSKLLVNRGPESAPCLRGRLDFLPPLHNTHASSRIRSHSWKLGITRSLKRQPSWNKSHHGIAAALNNSSSPEPEVFQGMYGPWSIDSNDVREVLLYRAGLVTTAIALVTASLRAFLPDDSFLYSTIDQGSDILYGLGATGLGVSLLLIHIYVTPIKRTLQLLWAVGVLGSLVVALNFAAPADESLVNYVLENHWAIWLVGPLFASLTGLVFKEGLCYGKLEAAILVFIIPTVLIAHLSGLADAKVEVLLLFAWIALYTVFTARKFTQPIKDDLGDKSIFMFNALPKEEKQRLMMKLRGQGMADGEETT